VTQFALVMGILLADGAAFPFATADKWRILFGISPVVAILQLLLAPFLLESPRWLLSRDPKSLKARYILKHLRGLRYDHEVETELGHLLLGGAAQQQEQTSTWAVLQDMIRNRHLRTLLLSALALQMAQQFSGINAVFYYSNTFFDGVIDNPLLGTTIVAAVNVLATYVALLLMDRCGRKTLILWSSGGYVHTRIKQQWMCRANSFMLELESCEWKLSHHSLFARFIIPTACSSVASLSYWDCWDISITWWHSSP